MQSRGQEQYIYIYKETLKICNVSQGKEEKKKHLTCINASRGQEQQKKRKNRHLRCMNVSQGKEQEKRNTQDTEMCLEVKNNKRRK